MEKKILYLCICCLFFASNAKAQGFTTGIRGGISIPDLTAGSNNQNPLNTGYGSRLGDDAALFGAYTIKKFGGYIVTKSFSMQLMGEYSSQGGKKDGMQALATPAGMFPAGQAPTYLYANYNSEAKLDYLLVPVLAKLSWEFEKTHLKLYVDAGPFVGFLLAAHQITNGESPLYLDPSGKDAISQNQSFNDNTNIKNQLHIVNLGIEGNVGLSYRIGMNCLFFEIGGNYGFLNIQKGAANGKNNTGAATAAIGYGFRIR